jgi:hypothetical protein
MRHVSETAFPVGLRTPVKEPEGAQFERAQRDREAAQLERRIAYNAARTDIESHCIGEGIREGKTGPVFWWWDTARIAPAPECAEDIEFLSDAVRYLDLRRLLVRHPDRPNLVRIKDWP